MQSCQVKIFSTDNTPRLRYMAGILLGDILGLNWEIITDINLIGDKPVINYSNSAIPGSFRISPCPLLFEKDIKPLEITVREWKGLPVLFPVDRDSDLPFDIFAASFYLISRYEEYLDFLPDRHGRFPASLSVAFRNGFLTIPVVDLWTKQLSRELAGKYPGLKFRFSDYNALLTIDSDQPFAFLGKGPVRSFGGIIKDIALRPGNIAKRLSVLTGKSKDPYFVYDYIYRNIERNGTDAKFFFPVGTYSKYDRNPSWKSMAYRKLIRETGSRYPAGLHPSYYAGDNSAVFRSERAKLNKILGIQTGISRFHFLRFKMPGSFKMLEEEKLSEDHSMGYPDKPGFRAGIARPFMFYDLNEEKQTDLKIVPFQVMDATLFDYMKLDAIAAEQVIINLIQETRRAGGLFVSLWHNTTLQDNPEWQGWRILFEKMLKIQQP